MSDRYGSNPPEEPVIGAPPPPLPPQAPDRFGAAPAGLEETDAYGYDEEWDPEDAAHDDGEYYDDEYDPEYDDYYDDEPARQPMFYLFIALAVLVGAAAVFLLFTVVRSEDDGQAVTPVPASVVINAQIVEPVSGERFPVGEDQEVRVEASASESIAKFQLFVQDQPEQEVAAAAPDAAGIYRTTLTLRLPRRADYTVFARITTASGATKDTEKIQVSAVQDIGTARPDVIRGRVTATVNLRARPLDDAESIATLRPGQEVGITGRTPNSEWLFLDLNGGGWVKRAGIEVFDSLELVTVREATPTPAPPTATPVPLPSPSPSPTATPDNAPDFVPRDAELVNGGRTLRIFIGNASSNGYEGSLVVEISGVSAVQSEKAFGVSMPGNGSTMVEFELDPPLSDRSAVQVQVDPSNAIRETDENNNGTTFQLSPPVEQPELSVDTLVQGESVLVRIVNQGGDLSANAVVTVSLTSGDASSTTTASAQLEIRRGTSQTVTVPKPTGTGDAAVEVTIGGQVVAQGSVSIE